MDLGGCSSNVINYSSYNNIIWIFPWMPTILAHLSDGENEMQVFLIFKLAPARFYRSKRVSDLSPRDEA